MSVNINRFRMNRNTIRATLRNFVIPLSVLLTLAVHCETHVADVREVVSIEGITEYELSNGLRVLLYPDQGNDQIIVNITYLVGSRHEGYGETGMAHLVEHLVFKGSTKHPNIAQELTERGASANGTTWTDRTNYFETITATDENLEWALDLEADRMVNSFIRAEDLESEMTVVRNEWESGENSPGRVLTQRVTQTAFGWHNYGKATIGARTDIENMPIERVRQFYRRYYQPDNAVLVVAGRIDVDRTLELVVEKFGSIPRPERTGAMAIFRTYTREPAQDGERTVTLRRVGDVQRLRIAHHVPGVSSDEYPTVVVLAHVLGATISSRLHKNLVDTNLAANAYAYAMRFREPGLLMIGAEIRKDKSMNEAHHAILATVEDVIENPPTKEELDRAKTDFNASMNRQFDDVLFFGRQLSEWIAAGDWRLYFLYRDGLQEVTAADVHAVAAKYLIPSNRTTGFFFPVDDTPERAEIPAEPDIDELVGSYVSTREIALGEAFDPSLENIDARTQIATLSNGVKVALLSKENRGDKVRVDLRFRHGTEESLFGRVTVANFAGGMLMRGSVNRTKSEIADELDRLEALGSAYGDITSCGAGFTTKRDSLPAVLRLTAEVLQHPSFPEDEFQQQKESMLAGIEASMSEPGSKANIALYRHTRPYPEHHPNYVSTLEERHAEVTETTLAEVKAFYDEFYGAEGGTIVVVGDFDPQEILPLLEELFGDWQAERPYERIVSEYIDVDAADLEIETPDKTNAYLYAVQYLPMRDDHPDAPALRVGGFILGSGFLNSRLATRIRQEEGLSYGVSAGFGAGSLDKLGSLAGYAIFAPQNSSRVFAAFTEEITKVLEEGFTAEEVEAAKAGMLNQRENSRIGDSSIAGLLQRNLFLDRKMQYTIDYDAKIAALTVDDVNEAFRRHIDLDKFSFARAGDFANNPTGE